jgi:hypothetical protein
MLALLTCAFLADTSLAQSSPQPNLPAAPSASQQQSQNAAPTSKPGDQNQEGQQTKRILGLAPNFTAVSANTQPPPLSVRRKFWLATQSSFDYSSFIAIGFEAGIELATNTYPEFHEGAAGYGRYYWHSFADAGIENYLTGAIAPAITHEDPRYYTLYQGGFLHRTAYAFSRLWITRKDDGSRTYNYSEVLGSGIATVVSSRYYPIEERKTNQVLERWGSQLLSDGIGNVFQEFWPDIHQKFFHRH